MSDDAQPEVELREVPNEAISVTSAVREIVFDETARDAVDVHVATDTRVEKGGVLVGDVDVQSGRVYVVAAIPAERAISAAASLTFTHEVWDDVNEILSRDYPDHRMVGWYHSHPHFGIFLSEYDTFIQSNFFSAPWQLAYVVDPLLGQSGVFGWEDGNIVRYRSWTVLAHGSAKAIAEPERGAERGEDASPKRPGRMSGPSAVIAIGLIALLAGIVGGYLARGSDSAAAPAAGAEDLVVASSPVVHAGKDLTVQRSWARADGTLEMAVVVENVSGRDAFGYISHCAVVVPPEPTSTRPAPGTTVGSQSGARGPIGQPVLRSESCSFDRTGIPAHRARTFEFIASSFGPIPVAALSSADIVHLMQGAPAPTFVAHQVASPRASTSGSKAVTTTTRNVS